tara:strand:+ start:1199 stop:1747 length:549 start_codon:yes stop_codon:yes gene_type:complete
MDSINPRLPQKIRLCRHFEKGFCRRGSTCHFAHGLDDLQLPPASVVYGIERPSSESPKPPPGIEIGITEHWNVLDFPAPSATQPNATREDGRDPRLAGETTTNMGANVSELSTYSLERRSDINHSRKPSAKVHSIYETIPYDASRKTIDGSLHPWVKPNGLHRMPIPYAGRKLQPTGRHGVF